MKGWKSVLKGGKDNPSGAEERLQKGFEKSMLKG